MRSRGEPIYRDADALRLAKRLRKHWNHLFTFLDKRDVPLDNDLAERQIRPRSSYGRTAPPRLFVWVA